MLRLVSGANTEETAALNENGGITQTNLIRFQPDPAGGAILAQKLGGWSKFNSSVMAAVVRALWAWEDIDDGAHLALGTQVYPNGLRSQLAVITGGTLTDITPIQAFSSIISPTIVATIGSAAITITDAVTTGITDVCSVYIPIHTAVGGIVLFGLYPCDPDGFSGGSSYTVYARDILGNLMPATTTAGPTFPVFHAITGSNVLTVTLTNHGFGAGQTFPVLGVPIVGGDIGLHGNHIIQSIVDANNFTIVTPVAATATGAYPYGEGLFIYNGLGAIPASAVPIKSQDWTLDNFGEDLIACPTTTTTNILAEIPYQPIYLWSPETQLTAAVIPQAPPVNDGIFVAMPQRQIVAWGSTQTGIQDPLLINWSDVNNPYQWIALVTNQAGSYRIPKGSRIVGCLQGPQQALIWTDIDVWSMQYIGPPLVYSFNEIGSGCGMIARKAAGFLNGICYWMGPSQIYTLSGDGVLPLPCPVWDVIFQNLKAGNDANGIPYVSRIRFAANSRFNEIQWFYPSANGTGEVDSYVKYNVVLGLWDYGSLGRSAWVDQSVLGPPIGADPVANLLYQHETSNDADGQAMLPSFQTGYFTIAEGDFKTFIDLIWPDFKWGQYSQAQTAQVQITFLVVNYPGDTPTAYGPYTVTQATKYFNTRLRGRLVAIKISSSDLGSFWRIGALRYRYAPDGKF